MRHHLLFVLLHVLLVTPAAAEDEKSRSPVDGWYFLRGGLDSIRIDGRRFMCRSHANPGHVLGGTVYTYAGGIQLRYHAGDRPVRLRATYAIVDGHLWLGVFRRRKSDGTWTCRLESAQLFAAHAERLRFDGTMQWRKDRVWCEANGKTSMSLAKIERIYPPGHEGSDGPFIPVFRDGKKFLELCSTRFTGSWPQHRFNDAASTTVSPLGIGSDRAWTLAALARTLKPGGESDPKKAFSILHGDVRKLYRRQTRGYRQKGDVIIAPWSIDLGPVGLVPARRRADDVVGKWTDVADPSYAFEVRKPPDKKKKKKKGAGILRELGGVLGRPTKKILNRALHEGSYAPNKDGVVVGGVYFNCVMGHADYPGFVIWFVTLDGRLLRLVRPGNHGPWDKKRVRLFRKAKKGD